MKTQTSFLATLTNNEIKTLTTQVAETLALKSNTTKTFTAADLWSIQKQRRTFAVRRF